MNYYVPHRLDPWDQNSGSRFVRVEDAITSDSPLASWRFGDSPSGGASAPHSIMVCLTRSWILTLFLWVDAPCDASISSNAAEGKLILLSLLLLPFVANQSFC